MTKFITKLWYIQDMSCLCYTLPFLWEFCKHQSFILDVVHLLAFTSALFQDSIHLSLMDVAEY